MKTSVRHPAGYIVTALSTIFLTTTAMAATMLGPLPYLSRSDSPFNGASLGYFYLDDFEDGTLSTPGVSSSLPFVLGGPGWSADSVDGDDGHIDGLGRNGISWLTLSNTITLAFDGSALGHLPTHVGIVLTDANGPVLTNGSASVVFEAFDSNNVSVGVIGPVSYGDGSGFGGTAEDRFFGAISTGGIKSIVLTSQTGVDMEIDHLQYGGPAAPSGSLLGPSTYLSFADSPFNGVSLGYFHLETFEDHNLDTPGVTSTTAFVSGGPGSSADSVDADDGVIDGFGKNGVSWLVLTNSITFTFDDVTLGNLPTHAGVVVTDGNGPIPSNGSALVAFEAFDSNGLSLGVIGPMGYGDGSGLGGTAEDRFFGATYTGGIKSITLSMLNNSDWELDHLQYGGPIAPPPVVPPTGNMLGPSPYLSFSNSPFYGVTFDYFQLETCEDSAFNVPGVSASRPFIAGGPGPSADSVDADDGAVDGFGKNGVSWLVLTNSITFTFNSNTLSQLPTHAGVVLTDATGPIHTNGSASVVFEAFDGSGTSLGIIGPVGFGDTSGLGTTAEDRFFGTSYTGGIKSITLTIQNCTDWEMDHLQYGGPTNIPPPARADLLGPSAYLSFSNSPFHNLSLGYLYVEDLEDWAFNVPGVTASEPFIRGGPGSSADSVDADDGAVDGFGRNGASWLVLNNSITFTFDDSVLGALPTHAGVVLTDAIGPVHTNGSASVIFEAFDTNGTALGIIGPLGYGDANGLGGTAEDRFYGASYTGGIKSITLTIQNCSDWELDHLQYGGPAGPPPPPPTGNMLGPSPYLSFSDSPFNGLTFGSFYLEDFEDKAFNTPGVTASTPFVIGGPGASADSVDADDGSIDGMGQNGVSWFVMTNAVSFTFDSAVLGSLPTHAGVVWTDGTGPSHTNGSAHVRFEAFDANSNSLGVVGPAGLGDSSGYGQTAEDRFFGATYTGGIKKITLTMLNGPNMEIDHLQYGGAAAPSVETNGLPYLSFTDSPYSAMSFSYFHLEDFEDLSMDTPGLSASTPFNIGGPGESADSVDADDGLIDGNGNGGVSWLVLTNEVTLSFDSTVLGDYPTHVGFAWTDGEPTNAEPKGLLTYEAFDAQGTSMGVQGPFSLGDGSGLGGTAEDRFFGAMHEGGISALRLTMLNCDDWEIDHIQYGHKSSPAGFTAATPYLALQDSPFLGLNFGYFYVEDCEDGQFNVPGATSDRPFIAGGPGDSADSVDGDDGAIDGFGKDGVSWLVLPNSITFYFATNGLGPLPSHVGLACTDVHSLSSSQQYDEVYFEALDAQGHSLGTNGPVRVGDGSGFGGTAEDRFFGVVNLAGISAVRMSVNLGDWEVDHLQYGLSAYVDRDADGLPDYWEYQYWPTNNSGGANLDADSDGYSNYAEWLTGSDPTDSSSAFALPELKTEPGQTANLIYWSSLTNRLYTIEFATKLQQGFAVLESDIAATPPLNTFTDTLHSASDVIYYRLKVGQ